LFVRGRAHFRGQAVRAGARTACPVLLAVSWYLPRPECFRYHLPNFPHSPARGGRERQGFDVFLADTRQTLPLFRLIQLIRLSGDHLVTPAVKLQPLLELQIPFHPAPAGIQDQEGKIQRLPVQQVALDQVSPLAGHLLGNPGVTVPGEIDEIERSVDSVKIERLRAARSATGESQPFAPYQGVNQAGLPYVTSP